MEEAKASIDFPTEPIKEGNVKILVPELKAFVKQPSDYAPSKAPVFYNPVMELNRDLAVIALRAYQKMMGHEISVCEPLTGCGIRGIRYAVEVEDVKEVWMSDINETAFQLARYNVQTSGLGERITLKHTEANLLLAQHSAPRKRFDVIDIDPFGSPAPYMESAIRALRNNGLLALTATDLAPLCGVHPKACIRKYGGKPLRTEYCHELAVRLLAGCLASAAAKHDIGTRIIFSHSANHYVRIYATIAYGAKKADESIKNMGYVLHCFNCFHRETAAQPLTHSGKCEECGLKLSVAGPLWLGKIADRQFCELMIEVAKRRSLRLADKIGKTLATVENEAEAPATYYVVDEICDALNLPVPPVRKVARSLVEEGFQTAPTHFSTKGIKTDAPAVKVREITKRLTQAA
jgi:tRNA (guanine26-N2/guanine27-N2)-dimethyltransferase